MSYRRKRKEEHAKTQVWENWTAAQAEAIDAAILKILTRRDGQRTEVVLDTGKVLQVYNIHFGYDLGATIALVYANDNPPLEGIKAGEIFFTNQVVSIVDPDSGAVWFEVENAIHEQA